MYRSYSDSLQSSRCLKVPIGLRFRKWNPLFKDGSLKTPLLTRSQTHRFRDEYPQGHMLHNAGRSDSGINDRPLITWTCSGLLFRLLIGRRNSKSGVPPWWFCVPRSTHHLDAKPGFVSPRRFNIQIHQTILIRSYYYMWYSTKSGWSRSLQAPKGV